MLRTALENMRFKACTADDIAFLHTRISRIGNKYPHISEKQFRNVSIITAQNAHKDKMNELGCHRFSRENNQKLINFYSVDRLVDYDIRQTKSGRAKRSRSLFN